MTDFPTQTAATGTTYGEAAPAQTAATGTTYGLAASLANADLCTHCGYCLPCCPTYRVNNDETRSPRGRVSILLALRDQNMDPVTALAALDHCLLCRACHTACPAGVLPARLILLAREAGPHKLPPWTSRLFHRLTVSHRLSNWAARLLQYYRRSGLQGWLRRRAWWCRVPLLGDLENMIPVTLGDPPAVGGVDFLAGGPAVALLCSCMGRIFYPGLALSAQHLLASLGYRVTVPQGFGCCGAPFLEGGDRKRFLQQARRTLDAFARHREVTAVVCDSTLCFMTARNYAQALEEDAAYRDLAREFTAKVAELSAFLVASGKMTPSLFGDPGLGRVAFHDHCQIRHTSGTVTVPREAWHVLQTSIAELPRPGSCCGAGGDYLLRHPETSQTIRQEKLADILASGADAVVAGNPGCLLHMEAGLRAAGSSVRALHVAELFWYARASKSVPLPDTREKRESGGNSSPGSR
ncbi:MAG: (Fe-S)-binding protein [Magnetococcales bacterium]|nr:(Fe-S)-binding protein [Magnetococcales bacterium]